MPLTKIKGVLDGGLGMVTAVMATVGLGFFSLQSVVYTRVEAHKAEAQIQQNALRLTELDSKYDTKLDQIQQQLLTVQRDLGRLLEATNRATYK